MKKFNHFEVAYSELTFMKAKKNEERLRSSFR